MSTVPDLEPDILSHGAKIARKSVERWRQLKHRRAAKCAENHKFANVGDSLNVMHKGTLIIKLRSSSKKYPRRYFLDQEAVNVRWTPSKKGDRAKIPITSIREVRVGSTTDAFTQCPEVYAEGRCFSIIHGDEFSTLDLVFPTQEESLHWTVGLRYLLAKNSAEDEPLRRQTSRDQWLKEVFLLADKSGDGLLSVDEVFSLMHKLNVKISNRKLREAFKAADTDDQDSEGLLDFNEFINFYKSISTRREIYLLLLKYGNSKEHMTVAELKMFLETEQKMSDVTDEHCSQIIHTYEPVQENRSVGILGIDGFTSYLLGPEGDIFNSQHSKVNQDMARPLSHYFIASSHNTYLLGDQLTSNSSMDMYVRVLQSGCRCIEIDCWDGKGGEPVVYHGYTMTSKVKFRYIILNINDFAFLNNKYPVILSLENHCSVSQQKVMAKLLRDIFKDKLVYETSFGGTDLPSPQSLMGKVLIKAKKLPVTFEEDLDEGEVTEEDSADEMEEYFKCKNSENSLEQKAKERKWRRTLASLQRLRLNKDDEENDARGDLSSAIVTSVALEEPGPTEASQTVPKLHRSLSAKYITNQHPQPAEIRKVKSFSEKDKKMKRRNKKRQTSKNEDDRKRTIKLSRQLSDLVAYTRSIAFKGLDLNENETYWEVISVPESKAYRYVDTKGEQFVRYTRYKLCRIYPAGYRIDSSNPNPQAFWNCGCQLVALNYQTEGRMMQIYRGKFKSNGNCGYVLKPDVMCEADPKFDPMTRKEIQGVSRKLCKIKVISGQQLPKPKDSILGDRGEIIDPYVEIEVIGIPADNCKRRTKTVMDNGFSPVWDETITFILTFPDLANFRFVVWDEDPIGRDFIGQVTLPFSSLMPGFRHVHLEGNQQASIFVHVTFADYRGEKIIEGLEMYNPERRYSGGVKFKKRQRRDTTLF